ncbi:MFS transporter [Desulfopila inferna]|uniref:MFS transporter n=1 Tax=Desulfopila inferna TaxID=468528 RepID=UPI001F054650|nr:MFS transporter [Desulfopila inferna]
MMKNATDSSSAVLPRLPIHYGWIIMVAGTVCIFACLGLGRFSLGMLLPSMGEALGLSYSQMGFISTANFVGYLGAVLISGRIMQRVGARNLIALALLLVSLSMMVISRSDSMTAITILYILTGMGSAMANIPIMALLSIWFAQHKRGKAAGFVVIGNGFAIILCGSLIPYINTLHSDGWRTNWLVLGGIVLCCAVLCYVVLRNNPAKEGLLPVGAESAEQQSRFRVQSSDDIALNSKIVLHCAAIYFLFGFTYVIYVTFVVTSMIVDRGYAESAAGIFWSCIGLLSLLSGPIPGAFSDKFGRKTALIAAFSIQAIAYLLVALPLPNIFLFVSIGCYGIVAWSVPSIISALVADYAGQQRVAAVFGFVTFIFGIGQISGPYLAGLLAEKTGSFAGSFFLAFCLAVVAIIFSLLLPAKKS